MRHSQNHWQASAARSVSTSAVRAGQRDSRITTRSGISLTQAQPRGRRFRCAPGAPRSIPPTGQAPRSPLQPSIRRGASGHDAHRRPDSTATFDGVVTAAQPNRAHVGVAVAKHSSITATADISRQRQGDGAHGGLRRDTDIAAQAVLTEHEEADRHPWSALTAGGASAPQRS